MNSITQLLDLEDSDIIINDIQIQDQTKTFTLETRPSAHFCPSCGFKMHSRGVKKRTIQHPFCKIIIPLFLS
jgi:predicted Zn-ribbon and HTH transcriptional regulator